MDEHPWISIEIGMPNSQVDVEIKGSGDKPIRGWYSLLDREWFIRGERHPSLISSVTHWRPLPKAQQLGQTADGQPITMTEHGESPEFYVLTIPFNRRETKWVDMATVQRLREALIATISQYRYNVGLLLRNAEIDKQADDALNTSPPCED